MRENKIDWQQHIWMMVRNIETMVNDGNTGNDVSKLC